MSERFHLHWQQWPEKDPRGSLVIVHGIGEHSGRYGHIASAMNESGLSVFSYDHRGHGRSPGKRGHIDSWDQYRDDLSAFLDLVRSQMGPAAPVFLFGHSMGGLIVLDFLISHPGAVAAAIVAGVPIQPAEVANPMLIFLARIMSRCWPSFTMRLGIEATQLSSDDSAAQSAKDDPLNHGFVSARWGTEILAAIDRVKNRTSEIQLPLLVLHGGADRINHPDGSRWLHERVSSRPKKLIIYEGARHEVHNDACRDRVIADITDWLRSRL